MTRKRFLLLATFLLVVFWLTRLHGLLTLPLFMDEATHLTRSQAVWQGKPFDLLLTGKALAPYLAALFFPFDGAIWIGRFVVVLISAVGLAAIIAAGSALHSRIAGLFAGALWVFSPYFFFFERTALVDTSLASMAVLACYFTVRMLRSGKLIDAVLCGLALALCVAAKATGLIYLSIPVGAWVVLAPRRFRQPILALLVAGLLLALPVIYIQSQAANVLGVGALSSVETSSLGARLSENPGRTWSAFQAYYNPVFWAFLLMSASVALVFWTRRTLIAAGLALVPFVVLTATATSLYLRYLVIILPGVLLAAGIGLAVVTRGMRQIRWVPALAVGAWIILFTLPFFATAYADPSKLPLPPSDRDEYLTGWTTGYGLRDVALALDQQAKTAPLSATALLGSCNTIRLYLARDSNVRFNCPDVWAPGGIEKGNLQILDDAEKHGYTFIITEENGPVYASAAPQPNQVVQTFPRPEGGYTVLLLRYPAPD